MKQVPSIRFCYHTSDIADIRLAEEYWSGAYLDERWVWTTTVKKLGDSAGLSSSEVLKNVRLHVEAFNASVLCNDCGLPHLLTSRVALGTAHAGLYVCEECRAMRLAQSERERKTKQAAISASARERITELSHQNQSYDFENIDYVDAVLLFSILLASDAAYESKEFTITPALKLCSSNELSSKVLGRLFSRGILQMTETTNTEAVVIDNEGKLSYFPHRVVWRVAADTAGRSTAKIMDLLGETIDSGHEHETYDSVSRLWWTLAYDDAAVFLRSEIEEYRLTDHKQGPKTEAAIIHALKNFSIPQVRREIRNVVKNAAALSVSRDFNKRHAMNTIPGTLISYIDRAISESWNVSCVLQNWQSEEPILLTVLFNRVLKTGLPGFKTRSGNGYEQNIGF